MRLISRNDSETVVEIPNFHVCNDNFINTTFKEVGSPQCVVFRPKEINRKDVAEFSRRFEPSKNWMGVFGFVLKRENVKSLASRIQEHEQLTIKNPVSLEEAQDVVWKRIKCYLVPKWNIFENQPRLGVTEDEVKKYVETNKVYQIFHVKKEVAMVSMFPNKTCLGEEVTQVTWMYIQPGLGHRLHSEVRRLVCKLLSSAEEKKLQAAIHPFNRPSMNLAYTLGFRPECIHILRK